MAHLLSFIYCEITVFSSKKYFPFIKLNLQIVKKKLFFYDLAYCNPALDSACMR